jgi:hypothetical protein
MLGGELLSGTLASIAPCNQWLGGVEQALDSYRRQLVVLYIA